MSELGDALRAYAVAVTEIGSEVRNYLAPGPARSTVRSTLSAHDLTVDESIVEWFEFCGGVVPGSRTAHVFQGRAYNSLAEALEQRAAAPDDEDPIDMSEMIPLTSDHPYLFAYLGSGQVVEYDVEIGWLDIAATLALWVRDEVRLLPEPGPHPAAEKFAPVSATPGSVDFDGRAKHQISTIIDWLQPRSVTKMWIDCAVALSKDNNHGLEQAQVAHLIELLVEGGIDAAANAVVIEGSQTSEGFHNLTVYFVEE